VASQPRIVATTIPLRRRPDDGAGFTTRSLQPVLRHAIIEPWNTPNSHLREDIIDVLESHNLQWLAIDVLRVGFGDQGPVTILISVDLRSTDGHLGNLVVRRCKAILKGHGLGDVECEIKESRINNLNNRRLAPITDSFPEIPRYREAYLHLTEALGSSLSPGYQTEAMVKDRAEAPEGTKGLYLRVTQNGGSSRIVALTCRHVAFLSEYEDGFTYQYSENSTPQFIVQLSDEVQSDRKNRLKRKYFKCKEDKKIISEQMERLSRRSERRIAFAHEFKSLDSLEKSGRDLYRAYKELDDPSSRIIGHVLFSAPYNVDQTHVDRSQGWGPWLRDWAFIDLYQEKHTSQLANLVNAVRVNERALIDLQGTAGEARPIALCTGNVVARNAPDGMLRLRGVLSEQEVKTYQTRDEVGRHVKTRYGEECLMVGKYGASTGLIWGYSNKVKSVTRHVLHDRVIHSEEWCIVGWNEQGFSHQGDSGSIVWDMYGRVAGLVTAGIGDDLAMNATYVTPISRLLADFERHGFKVEIL
jgi:hypothetical protein